MAAPRLALSLSLSLSLKVISPPYDCYGHYMMTCYLLALSIDAVHYRMEVLFFSIVICCVHILVWVHRHLICKYLTHSMCQLVLWPFDPLALGNFAVVAKLPLPQLPCLLATCFKLINKCGGKNYWINLVEIHRQGIVWDGHGLIRCWQICCHFFYHSGNLIIIGLMF